MMNSLPTDIVLEIFSRLPAKSIAVCCCMSKLCASILNSQDFRELFLTRSSCRPRLLFALGDLNNKWRFFSAPQPHYSSDKSSHVATADSYMKSLEDMQPYFCSYASGLMCCRQKRWIRKETELYIVHMICNPSTGQYTLLPKLMLNIIGADSTSFLGFDPVDRQFKVMFTDYNDQRILTLGTGEMRWRNIQCSLPHQVKNEGICINGILYYSGFTGRWPHTRRVLVCFDVRSEIFNFIEEKEVVECFDGFLINYKGKLGGLETNFDGRTLQLRMWVLEDLEKRKRSEYVYNLPENKFLQGNVSVVGTTASGEIVLISDYTYRSLYVFYFNPESNTLQSIEIQGFGILRIKDVKVFVDYVEDPRFDFVKATSLPERKLKQTSTSTSFKDHLQQVPGTPYAATSTSPTEQKTKPTGTSTSSKARLQLERGKFEIINKFDNLCLF